MNGIEHWLARRRPEPPDELADALRESLREVGKVEGATEDALGEAGLWRLEEARMRLGRVRESAFHLLAADALITYACEAALESDQPQDALFRILDIGLDCDSH